MKIPLTKGGEGETTAVVNMTAVMNTTAVVKPSGGCRDGFEKADQQPAPNPPEVPPYPRGDGIFINVAPQRGMRNSPENVR